MATRKTASPAPAPRTNTPQAERTTKKVGYSLSPAAIADISRVATELHFGNKSAAVEDIIFDGVESAAAPPSRIIAINISGKALAVLKKLATEASVSPDTMIEDLIFAAARRARGAQPAKAWKSSGYVLTPAAIEALDTYAQLHHGGNKTQALEELSALRVTRLR